MNPIEIVVCRYQEQPDWIKDVSRIFPVTIYNKGADDMCGLGYAEQLILPNVGRETQAWFHDLEKTISTRARHTVFLQADPTPHTGDHPFDLIGKIVSLAAQDILYAPISNFQIVCDVDGEPHHPGLPMKRGWEALFGDGHRPPLQMPEEIEGFAGGQFIVRNDVIEQYDRDFYARGNQFCKEEPLAAYVYERLWHSIWTQATRKLAQKENE